MNDPLLAPVQKGFGAPAFNRIIRAIIKYRVKPDRPGWEQTPEGVLPPPILEGGGVYNQPWDLLPGEEGGYTIRLGRISTDLYAHARTFEIQDADVEITPAAGEYVWLEFTNIHGEEPVLALKSGTWDFYPNFYNVENNTDGQPVYDTAVFLLWEFVEGQLPANTIGRQFEEFYGRPVLRSNDCVITWSSHTEEIDGDDRRFSIPILVSI